MVTQHQLTAGQAQVRESSPVRDWRSTTELHRCADE